MKNDFSKLINKRVILNKYLDAIVTAIETSIESIDRQIEIKNNLVDADEANENKLSITQLNKSKERYEKLKNKIENKQNLDNFDFNLLSIILVNASHRIGNTAATLAESAKTIAEIGKLFMA